MWQNLKTFVFFDGLQKKKILKRSQKTRTAKPAMKITTSPVKKITSLAKVTTPKAITCLLPSLELWRNGRSLG